jgi:uncharacterized membrane protein YgcG
MHVLEQPLVLDLVLQYAGPDQWLFLGAVSKAWAAMHTSVMHPRLARKQRLTLVASLVHTRATSFGEAASLLLRALYACDCDAKLRTEKLLPLSRGAASRGSIHVLIWAKAIAGSKWLDCHQQLCMAAAAGNQLRTLLWLRFSDPEQQWEAVNVAAKAAECAGLSMLQWVLEQQPEWTRESIERVIEGAARAADALDKIIWLCEHFPEDHLLGAHFIFASIKCGAVESLKWFVSESSGFRFDDEAFTSVACEAGQLAALRFLVEEANCPWNVAAVRDAAIKFDSAEMLEWASNADVAVWTTAVLSELLLAAAQDVKLCAADWLRAAGAEWPTSFFYTNHQFMRTLWPLRAMQWARANGCPWGVWKGKTCNRICALATYDPLSERQPTQDAMLWAHAAGCPCDNRWHRIAGLFVRKSHKSSTSSSSSSSSGSGSSSSSSIGHAGGDVYKDVDTHSRWNAMLFREVFINSGEADALTALLLLLVAATVVVIAILAV